MFGFLGNLFGTAKAVDNLVDKDNGLLVRAGTAIGNLHYSDQEQANNALALQTLTIDRLKALEPFKVMQRIMVTIIMVQWAILANVMIIAICLKQAVLVENLMAFAKTEFMWLPVLGAVSLYLLGGVIPSRNK